MVELYLMDSAVGFYGGILWWLLPLIAFSSSLGDIKCIIIAFDDPDAGKLQREQSQADTFMYIKQNGCAIYRKTQEYPIPNKRSSRTHGKLCKVSQFPLKLAWASTGHKVQGITLKKFTFLWVPTLTFHISRIAKSIESFESPFEDPTCSCLELFWVTFATKHQSLFEICTVRQKISAR